MTRIPARNSSFQPKEAVAFYLLSMTITDISMDTQKEM